jgi:ribosomal protein S18 acetylase RimI-like enzyme
MIKKLEKKDVGAVEEFFLAVAGDPETVVKFHPHPFDHQTAEKIANYNGRDMYFGTFVDNQMLAYGMLRFSDGYPDPSLGIVVRPGKQGLGLGSEMMDYMIVSAKESGSSSISLFVYKTNSAAHLYKRKGFVLSQSKREDGEWKGTLKL